MKKNVLFLSFIFVLSLISNSLSAQLLINEDFDYTVGDSLIAGGKASSDNATTSKTGWLTYSADATSAINSFTIANVGLSYNNYIGSGVGKALNILDNSGQDAIRVFCGSNTDGAAYTGPKTLYFAYMVKVPAGDTKGTDYFAAIKYTAGTSDANFFARTFAKVTDSEVKFGIIKSSAALDTIWSGNLSINDTHLLVLKYALGGLNGTTSTEETGHFDDVVDMFVDPVVGAAEPETPTMRSNSQLDKDAYRWNSGSTKVLGGLAALILRTPATTGLIPALTFDGLRIAETWSDAVSATTGVSKVTTNDQISVFADMNLKQLKVNMGNANCNKFEIYNIAGAKMMNNQISQSNFNINISTLNKGVYIIKFAGASNSFASKFSVQ